MNHCSECESVFEAHLTIPVDGHTLCIDCASRTGALGRWYESEWGYNPLEDADFSYEKLIEISVRWRKVKIRGAELE
jgi:hypothetical protein